MTGFERSFSVDSLLVHREFLRNIARSILYDENAADDVLQETWMAALQQPPEKIHRLRSWLASVTRNLSVNQRKADSRRLAREAAVAPAELLPSDADVLEREELRRKVVEAVLRLPEPYRSVMLLRFYEDRSPSEIALQLQTPTETVRTRIRRGLGILREDLDKHYGSDRKRWAMLLLPLASSKTASISIAGLGVIAASFVVVGMGVVLWKSSPSTSDDPAPIAAKHLPAFTHEPEETGAPREPVPETKHWIRGRVLDQHGAGVAGAELYFAADPYPFAGEPDIRLGIAGIEVKGGIPAKILVSDERGNFELFFDKPQRVYLTFGPEKENLWLKDEGGQWVDTPKDLSLIVERIPTAVVIGKVTDVSTGTALKNFLIGQASPEKNPHAWQRAQGETVRLIVALKTPEWPNPLDIVLLEPKWAASRQRVALRAGEEKVVEFAVQSSDAVAGRVLDLDGRPIENALVYFGAAKRMRGNEPFKPFLETRIQDGARTGTDGSFSLTGTGKELTVWHSHFSPKTVGLHQAKEIRLAKRGEIRGQILDAFGKPSSGLEIALDGFRKTQSDAEGNFSFGEVEAGIRGLKIPDWGWIAVEVRPGEISKLQLQGSFQEFVVPAAFPLHLADPKTSLVVGLDRISSMQEAKIRSGEFKVKALPGEYLLLTSSGHVGRVSMKGSNAAVDLGNESLIVQGVPGSRFHLVPLGWNELVELLATRLGMLEIPDSGMLEISPLLRGEYELLHAGDRSLAARVLVEGSSVVKLP